MGKKSRRKARVLTKDKRPSPSSSKSQSEHSEHSELAAESLESVVTGTKECKPCCHLEDGLNVQALTDKVSASDPGRCEDCRDGMADRKHSKGKANLVGKKGDSSTAIWVCLQCGHYSCGGVGLPRIAQCHAVRHQKQTRHPLVIQLKNPNLRWCFPCDSLVSLEVTNEDGSKRDALLDVVKLIKPSLGEKQEDSVDSSLPSTSGKSDSYLVRGLTNLGNTCFFNAVMQNLLAMNYVSDYFMKHDTSCGPLSISLKKAFNEARCDDGARNVMNLRSLFGCVCSKAPQFRGYQQQDSHELLRYLLDGLSSEELAFKKQLSGSTFVDSTFGGRVSSTVTCIECGFSSTIFEPILDLSLPMPMKKSPPKQHVSNRGKKSRAPPKRIPKIQPRNADNELCLISEVTAGLDSGESSQALEESSSVASVSKCENGGALESSFDMSWMDFVDVGNGEQLYEENDSTAENNGEIVSTSDGPPAFEEPKEEKEEACSSVTANETQEDQIFDGFGDLFNEPEVGFYSGGDKSSDSGLDEIDASEAPISVESCLAHFIKPEILADDNAWECENCSKRERAHERHQESGSNAHEESPLCNGSIPSNEDSNKMVKRDAKKRVVIDKAPLILTVHLKRFSQDGRGRLSKLNGHVQFGELLDLQPYMDPREAEKCVYRLLGVVEHLGTMRQGHYVAYVRGRHNWFHASDSYVRDASLDEVLRSQPYILFYEKLSI